MEIKTTAYDLNNNVIKCNNCDKDAGGFIMGIDQHIGYCSDHSPYSQQPEAKFVYKPDDNYKVSDGLSILKESWTIDSTGNNDENR